MIDSPQLAEYESIIARYTTVFIIFDIIFFVMVLLGVLLLIRFLISKKKLQDSNEYILYTIRGQEKERARIAHELHDTVAQDLRYCNNLLKKDDAQQYVTQVADILEKTLLQVRTISYNLSPADITENDFKANILNLCTSMTQVSSIKVRFSMPDNTNASFLNENDILNLYRILQEAFMNVIKHAQAEEAVLLVRNEIDKEEKGLYIFMSDDGCGFDVEDTVYQNIFPHSAMHFGLIGMKKRCQLIGAQFSIYSTPGEGTQICIFKPGDKSNTVHT